MTKELSIGGWTITNDGYTWWALREGEEPHAEISYLAAAQWAVANREVRPPENIRCGAPCGSYPFCPCGGGG